MRNLEIGASRGLQPHRRGERERETKDRPKETKKGKETKEKTDEAKIRKER